MIVPSQLVGQILGHYRIVEQIGAGGKGTVYRAHDERLDRDVAVKVLPTGRFADDAARKGFRREALTLSKLDHINIARVHDFDTQDGVDFLVMEYVIGTTLAERISKRGFSENEVLALGTQIVRALQDAHEVGILHRDLKPENIMISSKGEVKLLDFGLARLLQTTVTTTTESLDDLGPAGTLPYMAPEQLRGEPLDFRCDIYAIGTVFYEMSTGRRAFESKLSTALIDDIIRTSPPPPRRLNPSLSPRLEDIILKCLEKNSNDRYQSAKELGVDLRRVARAHTVSVAIPTTGLSIRHRDSGRRITSLAIGLIALSISIGAIIWRPWTTPLKREVVLVGDFRNRTDEEVFDNTIPELLTISLEQSGHISVFPSSRIPEVLERMERGPTSSIDELTGREICQREGLKAVIIGTINKIGGRYILTARAVNPEGRNVAITEEVLRDAGEVPASLDRLSRKLRTALGESKRSVQETLLPLSEVTSPSLEAIRAFSKGKAKLYAGSLEDAKAYFQKALELDPSFAMAHEYLGLVYLHQGNPVRAEEELKKTLPHLDHLSEVERQKILGDYNLVRRDFDQAVIHYKMLKELLPRDPAPSLNLAQCFLGKLDFDAALSETQEAIKLEATIGPQNNLAEIYLLKGDIRHALSTAQGILARAPNDIRGMENLGWGYLLGGQSAEASHIFQRMVQMGGDAESRARSALADIALSSGRYGEARSQLEAGISVDRRLGNSFAAKKKRISMLTTSPNYSIRNWQHDQVGSDPQLILLAGLLYARANFRPALVTTCVQLDASLKGNDVPTLHSFREMLGAELAHLDKKPGAAVEAAKRAVNFENSSLALEILAQSYDAAHRPAEAISAYEKVLARGSERSQSYDSPAYHELIEIHYHLGVLYQNIGEMTIARAHLEEFLRQWSHPDGPSQIYSDAKARLR
jgi:eukaryotic-like serine/threonine-protein kinase